MKRTTSTMLWSIICLFTFLSCTREGPEGPQGSQGPSGPQGPTGSANVIYSNWFSFSNAQWGDTVLYGLPYKRAIRTVTSLTQPIFDNGAILTYVRFTAPNTNANLIPYIQYYVNQQTFEAHNSIINVGRLIFTFQNVVNGGVVNFPPAGNQYRYILIPGGVLGGRTTGEALYQGYTMEQLKAMKYEQVVKLFEIPEYGSNASH